MASPGSKIAPKPKGQQAPKKPTNRKPASKDPKVAKAFSAYNTLSGSRRHLDMARSLILPGSVSSVRPYPANAPAQLCSRLVRKNYVLSSNNISADGRTAIVVTPNLYGPAYIMKPGAIVLPLAPHPFSIAGEFTTDSTYVLGAFKGPGQFKSGDGSQSDLALPQSVTLAGDTRAVWDISCASVCTVNVVMKKIAQHEGYVRVRFFTSVAGAWAAPFVGVALSGMNVEVQTTLSLAANTRYFGFYFEDMNGVASSDPTIKVSMHISYGEAGQTPQATLGGSSDHLFQEIPEYLLDSGIDSGVVNSVAVLVSNTSSALEKQGEIFAARAPRDILYDWGSIQDSMVALPANREYHGPAETGAYAWWMPDTVESANPTTLAEYTDIVRKQDILLFYIKGLSANSSFNVTFVWNVSFHTRNQLFEKITTPPLTPEWARMYHALSLLPAASCNPEHENLFRTIVKKGAKVVGDTYAHYREHQDVYNGLLSILMSLL